jgi:hypothetical protein
MAMVGKVLRLGDIEELFGLLYPVHECRPWEMRYAWKPE